MKWGNEFTNQNKTSVTNELYNITLYTLTFRWKFSFTENVLWLTANSYSCTLELHALHLRPALSSWGPPSDLSPRADERKEAVKGGGVRWLRHRTPPSHFKFTISMGSAWESVCAARARANEQFSLKETHLEPKKCSGDALMVLEPLCHFK